MDATIMMGTYNSICIEYFSSLIYFHISSCLGKKSIGKNKNIQVSEGQYYPYFSEPTLRILIPAISFWLLWSSLWNIWGTLSYHCTMVNIDKRRVWLSKIHIWMDFELGQFSEGLKHQTNRNNRILGFSFQRKKF